MNPPSKKFHNRQNLKINKQEKEVLKESQSLVQESDAFKHAKEEFDSYFYRLVILNEISRIIASGFKFETIIYSIIQAIRRLLKFDSACVYLIDEERKAATIFTLETKTFSGELIRKNQIRLSKLGYNIIENRKGVVIDNLKSSKDPISQEFVQADIHSYIIVPLISRNKVLGLFSLGNNKKSNYNEESLFIFQSIADQITPGVERFMLYKALKEDKERLKAHYEGNPIPTYTWRKLEKKFILIDYNDAAKLVSNNRVIDFKGKTADMFYQDTSEILADMFRCYNEKKNIKREIISNLWSPNQKRCLLLSYIFVPNDIIIMHSQDITERKRVEEEMKERLMKFKLENGNIYLVKDLSPTLSFEAFKDLLNVNYKGFVFSRMPNKEFREIFDGQFKYFWLSEVGGPQSLPPDLKKIEIKLENIPNKSAVLIDRLDYLIHKNSFKEALSFIQHLRDLAYLASLIIIVSIDPSTLGEQELRLLVKETKKVKPRYMVKLPETLFEILKFVYEQNNLGNKPCYTDVRLKIGITKPTVRKRLKGLLSFGYISETKKGNKKIIELTPKGWKLFLK